MNKEITKDLENIIKEIAQRIKYNDWASSSFLWRKANEIKEVINKINKQ